MSSRSRLSPLRAAFRMGRRDVWRNRGRSALIAVMVALPVMAMATTSVLFRSDQHDPKDVVQVTLGDEAQAQVRYIGALQVQQEQQGELYGSTGSSSVPRFSGREEIRDALKSRISARNRLIQDVRLDTDQQVRFQGRPLGLQLRELDYRQEGLGGLVDQVSGRAPAASGEVVISKALSRQTELKAGDVLEFTPNPTSSPRSLTVVGVVGGENLVGDRTVLGRPGELIPDGSGSTLARRTSWTTAGPHRSGWSSVPTR